MAGTVLSEMKLSLPLVAKGRGPCGVVTIVSLCMSGLKEVLKICSSSVVSSVLLEYREIVGRCIKDFHGFEVFSNKDQFLIVYQNPWDALNCCLTTQSAFFQSTWPSEVLSCQACTKSEERYYDSSRKTLVFNGPRVQIGITRGKIYSEYNFANRSTIYSGSQLNLAVSIAHIAKGGQVLVNATAWCEVQRPQLTPCVNKDTGKHEVEGCENKIRLIEVLPVALSERSKIFGTSCSDCGDTVRQDQGYIKALGRNWHLKHFRCCHCKIPLMDSYMIKDGLPFCLDDFFMLHAHTCHGCDTLITGSYVEAMFTYWHPSCFVCQKCCRPPEKNEDIYEVNALPFCLNCCREVADAVSRKETKRKNDEEVMKHQAAVNL